MRDVRLLPLVIVAVAALLALKGLGLMAGGQALVGGVGAALAQDAAAPEAEAEAEAGADGDAAPAAGDPAEPAAPQAAPTPNEQEDSLIRRMFGSTSRSRDAVMENLAERRQELEDRASELDLRESLLKAAEQRVEQRIGELRELEARVTGADRQRREEDEQRLKNLVAMYADMKPKDAARIFNGLDMSILVRVTSLMNARQMSGVMAAMNPEVAQRLTVELSRESADPIALPAEDGELPKIVGTRPAQ